MPEIDMEKIDGAYHLWIDGKFSGVYKDLDEVSKIFQEEEQENGKIHQDSD